MLINYIVFVILQKNQELCKLIVELGNFSFYN